MLCESCGTANPDSNAVRFCITCGEPFTAYTGATQRLQSEESPFSSVPDELRAYFDEYEDKRRAKYGIRYTLTDYGVRDKQHNLTNPRE